MCIFAGRFDLIYIVSVFMPTLKIETKFEPISIKIELIPNKSYKVGFYNNFARRLSCLAVKLFVHFLIL